MYGGLPSSWIKIGEWTVTDFNVALGYETVTFFSINKENEEDLKSKLMEFSQRLPGSVVYKDFSENTFPKSHWTNNKKMLIS